MPTNSPFIAAIIVKNCIKDEENGGQSERQKRTEKHITLEETQQPPRVTSAVIESKLLLKL